MTPTAELQRLVEVEVDRLEAARPRRPLTDDEHDLSVYLIAALVRLEDGDQVPRRIIDRLPPHIRDQFPAADANR